MEVLMHRHPCNEALALGELLAWVAGAVALFLLCSCAEAIEPGVVSSEFIFEKAPFPQCHASTLAETKGGLVAAWFGGTREKNPDVGIWVSRLEADKWSTPVQVADGKQ